jgi:hypothetical protein
MSIYTKANTLLIININSHRNTSGVMETKNLPCHHIAPQSIHD